MKLGMSGSREGMTPDALNYLKKFVEMNEINEVHHGDCKGADKEFHDFFSSKNQRYGFSIVKIVIHPPIKTYYRAYCKSEFIKPEKDYVERNKDIVDETDMLIAFPKPTSKGTIIAIFFNYRFT